LIDQVGTYECQSGAFCDAVREAFDSRRVVLATATTSDHPFLEELKARPDTEVVHVTMANRSTLPTRIARRLAALVAGEPASVG
jgi:nucleoside-triphosphatase